jgi:uncharacterized protein YhbP (UPF0306 family)
MSAPDEPLFENKSAPDDPAVDTSPALESRIRKLVDSQSYGILCVEHGGQPYGALVAFVFSRELRHAVFATPIETRKHRSLTANNRAALVVDSRSSHPDELMGVEAVTATGRAHRIEGDEELSRWTELLIGRHAYLRDFVKAPTCALYRLDVVRFLHVTRFQEVSQWLPGNG